MKLIYTCFLYARKPMYTNMRPRSPVSRADWLLNKLFRSEARAKAVCEITVGFMMMKISLRSGAVLCVLFPGSNRIKAYALIGLY